MSHQHLRRFYLKFYLLITPRLLSVLKLNVSKLNNSDRAKKTNPKPLLVPIDAMYDLQQTDRLGFSF